MPKTFSARHSTLVTVVNLLVGLLLCAQPAHAGAAQTAPIAGGAAGKSSSQPGPAEPASSPLPVVAASPAPTPKDAPRGQEEKSEFEKYVTGKGPASLEISQFGYDLFVKPPSSFAPVTHVPVGPDYVVGPGDEIKIEIWGRIEGNWSVVVSDDGTISLPKTGVFGVTGLTFRELKELLHSKLSKYYSGFEMHVSMGSLRTIQVYLFGNAQRPGAYTISSLSTVINALFESGGPSKTGSMRNILVKRKGKTVVSFDLYDLLLQGDKTRDIRLMPEDVIFIPPCGPLVAIAGNVRTPAIFELKGETRLLELIRMAGGLTGIAFKGRLQMQRIEDHKFRTLFEGDLLDIETSPAKNLVLKDGDLARIFMVSDTANTVTVDGAVARPGEYGVNPGVTTVKDLLSRAGGLLYNAFDRAEVTRVTATQAGPTTEIFQVDLVKASQDDPQHNVPLQLNDYLLVRSVPEWSLQRTVTLNGEVRFPGTYTFKQGETLSSVIERAGGFTARAYLRGAQFSRERVREQQQRQIHEMVERLERELTGSGTAQVATSASPEEAKLVQLELEQKRQFIQELKTVRAKGRIALNISEMASLRGSTYDIELEQGDVISIPSDPKTVQVIGSVYNQSAFVYQPRQEHSYYVDLAGGPTPNADRGNTFILLANGAAVKAGGSFFGSGTPLGSGDTVVIPEKTERVAWMRNIKDITQILFQIAVSAGVLIKIF